MRYIFLIIVIIFASAAASARCTVNGIFALSKSSTLNRNGLVILEFYASSQSLVQGLNKKYPIYLQSKKDRIPLLVLEILKGEFQLTQVVFKPGSELVANETYDLVIGNLPKHEQKPQRYNSQTKTWENISFKILNTIDTDIPILKNPVKETKKTLVHYGCGPAKWVYFDIAGHDGSELFVRASVKSKTTGKTTEYIIAIENGQVQIGHGMCSGAFHFDNGDSYEVTFSLFDQSGNKSGPTNTISFNSPATATDDE